jgi:hypothetical protein
MYPFITIKKKKERKKEKDKFKFQLTGLIFVAHENYT